MLKVAKFEKVSLEQFLKDCEDYVKVNGEDYVKQVYENIKLPQRATSGSAGYDFFSPFNYYLDVDSSVKIPTGIRCKMDEGWVLKMYPRSGHGFKYGIHLANTVGVIDEDYYNADNEGHIFVKIVNDSTIADDVKISKGDAFCQGVFELFGITEDDEVENKRTGGLGSTSKGRGASA